MKITMYSQNQAGTGSDPTAQSDSRMVADILSSMANGEGVTPTTLAVMEGFCTGIPTRTTPTLTPTTLRNIEQTYLEFQNIASQPEEHVHQAGFVPPVVTSIITAASTRPSTKQVVYQTSIGTKDNQQEWYGEPNGPVRAMSVLQSGGSVNSRVGARSVSQTKTRGTGGRRPVKDDRISPEEEERRRVRRERNKMAAARCRKRRMDHTNSLVDETDDLEEKKQELQNEIQALQNEKEELEFILEAHRAVCKIKGSSVMLQRRPVAPPTVSPPIIKVKEETPLSDSEEEPMMKCMPVPISRPRTITRPTSLPIASMFSSPSLKMSNPSAAAEATGVPVQTPSTGIFNFDALMEGGTGLTPVSSGLTPLIPTCSGQQRNSNNSIELDSPDSMLPSKLVSL